MNYVRKHYIEHIKRLVEMGKSFEEATKFARFRVFNDPPGAYGAGVNLVVESSGWKKNEDLAKVWIQWSGYAYSREDFGVNAYESLMLNLRLIEAYERGLWKTSELIKTLWVLSSGSMAVRKRISVILNPLIKYDAWRLNG